MVRSRFRRFRRRAGDELRAAFQEKHPPHDVAASFSFGAFVTTLPTLGTGLILFAIMAKKIKRVSPIALFAPVIFLNPVAKWGVYALSFWIGVLLLGPVPGGVPTELSLSAGSDVAIRILVGNVILAVIFAVIGYVVVLRGTRAYRRRDIDLVERIVEARAED